MLDAELLAICCCPETHQEIRLAEPSLLAGLNQKIAAGAVKNRGGQLVAEPLETGLVRADGKVIYPVRGNIPQLLLEEGILLPP